MDKRIGIIGIMIEDFSQVGTVSRILSEYGDTIIGRQGINLKTNHLRVISLIVEATTDEIGALTGKLGRLHGVRVKSILSRTQEEKDANPPDQNDVVYPER
ncbi:TM1266 family iron-only hydrogenase system putative regulator [Thermospira aquatica]|uniref:Iron-only hydrogenase system regulator n=1 Tax=Thermospira aquatica TaxID=2828656 RepID=A0AAX3BBF7_9SPIR|nr:TM1266 family iron-only hydrogenase system putative regulator [Thermospira aquatica]URA09548.1 iron-only hydrogenase system regulator [Thermospira aquatica]